jgi:hypothetical protein
VVIGSRRLERDDFPLLSWWLSRPHVKAWWAEDAELELIERRYGPAVDGLDATELFVVEVDGQAAGMVQRYRLDDNPDWEKALEPSGRQEGAAGIDYLIGDDKLVGIGVGPALIAGPDRSPRHRHMGALPRRW